MRIKTWACCLSIFMAVSGFAEKIYNEANGLVIMEIENTESPYDGWDFHATGTAGYPAGATGTGHLEYKRYGSGGWGVPSSPLVYKFKINKAGTYRLFLRAHKNLDPGDPGDKHNDCFVRMEGDFDSGSVDIPLSALLQDTKVFGGSDTAWSRATNMDGNGADHAAAYYEFKAGEIYTFTISGRSVQFNLDRIMFSHSDQGGWPNDSVFVNQPESALYGGPFVDAGEDKVINLPDTQVTLTGSATDDGTIAAYSWTQESGPNTASLSGASTAILTASGLVQGSYVFKLTATDSESNTASDTVTVDVLNIQVIEFDDVDGFSNGGLNGQQGWNAAANWTVNTSASGSVSTVDNNKLAVLNLPVQLAPGETYSFSMDFEFSGTYSVPTGFTYAMLAGLKAGTSTASVGTGAAEPDVNLQLQTDGKYRLLNNYAALSGASAISSGSPDGGDQMRLEYELTMGETAEATTYTARLQNLTDGTDTGVGTVTGYTTASVDYSGISTDVYNALAGSGAYMFFQRINPAANASGLSALQVNAISFSSTVSGPVADAGEDQVVNLPVTQVVLNGGGSVGGTIDTWSWSQISGPNTATLSGETTSNLTASALVAGTYVFRLTVTDDGGMSGSDDVGVLVIDPAAGGDVTVLGDEIIWHKVTLEMDGPLSDETATPNPFTDYRMDVTFTHAVSGTTYTVPGFFAADGDAANSSATSGNKWHCHFRPSEAGTWNYSVSFRFGSGVAMGSGASGAALPPYDGVAGSFDISAVNPATAPDLRSKGRLQYVDKHHLRFAGNGEYFLKYGPDSPENFLAYYEFDNTPSAGNKGNWKQFAAHSGHYNSDGELWQSTKGANIYGALNYLESRGANSISMLLYNVNGDGDRVFPYSSHGEMERFDCSKLDQWEMTFDHAEKKGIYLHFKLSETENDQDHDNGNLGDNRKLYYREMIARFGHHLALNWNISEEISMTYAQRSDALEYFEANDPWDNHRVFHTAPAADKSSWFDPHKGDSELTGVSLQTPDVTNGVSVFNETKTWVDESAAAGQPWVVACDEQGPGNLGVNAGFDLSRKYVLWANIMAGGAGSEYYSGGSDLSLDDYSHFDGLLVTSDYCVNDFFYGEAIPFWDMSNADGLLSGASAAHCLSDGTDTFVVYLAEGGTASIDLSSTAGSFDVRWFDPRNGGSLQSGSVTTVSGGGVVALGNAPSATTEDWAVLIRRDGGSSGGGGQTTLSVEPEADAYVLETNPTANTGSWNKLHIMGDASRRDAYFRFDLSSLSEKDVDQVFFKVKVFSHYQPQTPTAFIKSVADDSWLETEPRWGNVPIAGSTITSGIVPDAGLWLTLDVTDYVKAELAGDGKASFELTTTSTHLINLHAREAADTADRPHLSVVVNNPGGGFADFETEHNLSLGATGDDDGDGQKNLFEFALGSNPTNPSDTGMFYLDFTSDGNGHLFVPQLADAAGVGVQYTVEVCTNITDGIWNPLFTNGMFTNDLPEKADHDQIQYRFWAGNGSPEQRYIRIVVDQM